MVVVVVLVGMMYLVWRAQPLNENSEGGEGLVTPIYLTGDPGMLVTTCSNCSFM